MGAEPGDETCAAVAPDHATNVEVRRILQLARRHLRMDVAFIGRFEQGRRVFEDVVNGPSLTSTVAAEAVNGVSQRVASLPQPTSSDPLLSSYCGMIRRG